jgi:hypothetical protein
MIAPAPPIGGVVDSLRPVAGTSDSDLALNE